MNIDDMKHQENAPDAGLRSLWATVAQRLKHLSALRHHLFTQHMFLQCVAYSGVSTSLNCFLVLDLAHLKRQSAQAQVRHGVNYSHKDG